jgi:hypothetical protein
MSYIEKVFKYFGSMKQPGYSIIHVGYFVLCSFLGATGQPASSPIDLSVVSDPATMKGRFTTDIDANFFIAGAKFYGIRPAYYYGLGNGQHLFGLSIPVVHNIFLEDYAGFENTTGIGDIRMMYMLALYPKKAGASASRTSLYVEMTAPTGEYRLGRGAGAWMYKPGIIFTYNVDPEIAFYPEVRFQISKGDVNSQGGSNGIPDFQNPDKDGKLQDLTVQIPAVVQLSEWNGWFSLTPQYTQSLSIKEYFIFVRTEIGKMIGNKSSASLSISKFVAGQPRLNVIVQAKFQFFL